MKKVQIYTDGACSGNPGPGGWGAVLIYNGIEKELKGNAKETTNNRMELFAALAALRALKVGCEVELFSDSAYLVDSFNKNWVVSWKRKGWKNADKKEVKNQDLWKALLIELERHKVTFIKVKGHSDNEYNNRCDKMATSQIDLLVSRGD